MTSLVVGHSRDPASQEALRVARDLACRLGARLHVVHGINLGDYPIDPDAADWEAQAERTLAQQQRQVQTVLATFRQGWTYNASHGDPVRLISAAAEANDALMIIVGTRGAGLGPTIERFFDGSVSHGLIRRQHRPVVVVRAPRTCLPNDGNSGAASRTTRLRRGLTCHNGSPKIAIVKDLPGPVGNNTERGVSGPSSG
jgi:nucleotide-binding universal stress UspA family protein